MLSNIFRKNVGSISDIISYRSAGYSGINDYYELSDTGYKKNVIVFRCVQLISRALASVEWQTEQLLDKPNSNDIANKMLDLIKKPNSQMYKTSFMEQAISHLLLSGNCYILAVKNESDVPTSLHLLRPDRINIIPGQRNLPLGYEYRHYNKKHVFEVDQTDGHSDILHIKLFNPLDDWYGMSPVEVAMSSINQHNAIAQQNSSFLKNGGRPSGALMYKSSLDNQKREELKSNLRNLYEGGRNAGKILLLEGNFEWKEMGLSPKDLDFISGKELSSKEIALAFGVPSILIGQMSSATFSNYKEARYTFWEETLIPLLNIISGEFSNWFKMLFKTDISITYDLDSIPALSKRRETEWRKINNAEFLTINEKREALGYPSLKTTQNEQKIDNSDKKSIKI